jgi:type VI secretion system secreted protein VgrG
MDLYEIQFDSGESSLAVRRFSVHEAMSTPFTASVWAHSESPSIDIGAIVGQPAAFRIHFTNGEARTWNGVCSYFEQTHAERRHNKVQSVYHFRIVPQLWLTSHRHNHKIFQHLSIPDIVDKILDRWGLERTWKIERGAYPKHEYRVQYGESDFSFMSRLLEEAGIAYVFAGEKGDSPVLTFSDALHAGLFRRATSLPYEDNPTSVVGGELVTRVALVHEVRPGAYSIRDYDFRKPDLKLLGEAPKAKAPESLYEQYHYLPGGMFVETGKGGGTPIADDKGAARHDHPTGVKRATRGLEAARAGREAISFETNVCDLSAGMVWRIESHPHPDLGRDLLVTDTFIEGTATGDYRMFGYSVLADVPYRPPLATPRPQVVGVQSAIVVGPPSGGGVDREIHTDEFGRIRVQFPWDRDGANDDGSSCWIRTGEGWGGVAYGWLNLPRVGQEVIVTFLDGDPDRPVILGRTYNMMNPVPYHLPEHKTVSTWKSRSSPISDGFNEIRLEDLKGEELFYFQAEKNHRRLVKNDEILTVGHDRDKTVTGEEHETIDGNRLQVTEGERHEMTGSEHQVLIKGNKAQLIRKDEHEINEQNRMLLVQKDADLVVLGQKRERDEWDVAVHVKKDRREQTGKDHSMLVHQALHEKVGANFARETGKEMHYLAGEVGCGEAALDVTIKGPGGFLRIDATGIAISGTKVDINVSGSAGHGHGVHLKEPALAVEAMSKTGYLRAMADFKDHATVKALVETFEKGGGKKPDAMRTLQLLKIVQDLDVKTPKNGAIFWSGGGTKAGAVAEQLAKKRTLEGRPSIRLEQLEAGNKLQNVASAVKTDYATADPSWRLISRRLAQEASGEVTVVVCLPLRKDAVLVEELKTLSTNEKVTDIKCLCTVPDANGEFVSADGTQRYSLKPISVDDILESLKPKPSEAS